MVTSRNPAVPGKAFELSFDVAEREAIDPAVVYRNLTIEILTKEEKENKTNSQKAFFRMGVLYGSICFRGIGRTNQFGLIQHLHLIVDHMPI
jgi:hypothetical protein